MTDNTERLIKMLNKITDDIDMAYEEAGKIQFRQGRDWIFSELSDAHGHIVQAKQDARLISRGYETTKEYWNKSEVAE